MNKPNNPPEATMAAYVKQGDQIVLLLSRAETAMLEATETKQ